MEKIAITGMGLICASANTKEEFAMALYQGSTGMGPINLDTGGKPAYLGQITNSDTGYREYDRALSLASEAVKQALELENCNDIGLINATTLGGISSAEYFLDQYMKGRYRSPYQLIQYPMSAIGRFVVKRYKLKGPVMTFSSACISSFVALGYAIELLHSEVVKKVLVCAVDTLCNLTVHGFKSIGATSLDPARPFDRERKGLNLGEAAAAVLLERVDSLAPGTLELAGYGLSNDSFHLTAPDPEGKGLRYAIEKAMEEAGISPAEIDLVHAHGTGTKYNDEMELKVLEQLFSGLAPVPVFSTKGQTGHTLGPSGLLALIGGCMALRYEFIPGTKNFGISDLSLKHLALTADTQKCRDLSTILLTSSGFSGYNGALVIKKEG